MLLRCLLILLAVFGFASPASGSALHPIPGAEALYRSAQRRLTSSTIESRRPAIRELEQATLIDPGNPLYELLLARVYLQCGFLKRAQNRFERVVSLSPGDADGRFGLGQVWRRDWLKYLETRSLDRAIDNFSASARLKPNGAGAWVMLVPLHLARGDSLTALVAAEHAAQVEPLSPEAVLALALASYRVGHVHEADSLFRAVIPRLPRLAQERFDDISPVASERDTMTLHRLPLADQWKFIARFWIDNDPDLASPENEAQLEYWSRVAQAYFLYFDAKRREWDERGEVYVRYGPPRMAEYNPIGRVLSYSFSTGPAYPLNLLVWDYPELGMHVELQDRLLSEYYMLPITSDHDPDPQPNPDSLARRGDQLATSGGRGVFPKLPPGVKSLPVAGHVARFMTESGPRLIADVETRGEPGDSLWAEWVVLDSSRAEVARVRRTLAPSACDPADLRVADFAGDLPPGHYQVGISVQGAGPSRGVYRTAIDLSDTPDVLALSDVVVSCGTPSVGAGPGVRIEPNARGLVRPGGALTVYFEIYHLATSADGQSRFEYECSVRSAEQDTRMWVKRLFAPRPRIPDIATRREAENTGSLRRQFVSVPVQALPPGRYRLDISVRDMLTGGQVTAGTPFLKPEIVSAN